MRLKVVENAQGMSPRKLFKEFYNGEKNLLAPYTIACYEHKNLRFELAKGEGMDHELRYVVTALEIDGDIVIRRIDLYKVFNSFQEAKGYINTIKRGEQQCQEQEH